MSDAAKTRLPGLDIVRSVAALFVVSVHYFFNCGYYSTPMSGRVMFIMTLERWLFLCCVPLYMMLTGFFKCNKELNKAHFKSFIPVGIAYIILSVIKIFTGNHYYGKVYGIKESLQSLGTYTMAWYVGFYFSLMLIAPFLNRLWHALSKKEKHLLLIFLTVVATMYPLVSLPSTSEVTVISCIGSLFTFFAPNYWQMLYPLLYYFLGCYFKEYKPKLNKLLLIAVIIITVSANSLISYHYAMGGNFVWGILGTVDCGYNCITVVLCSASIFLLFYDIDLKGRVPKKIFYLISSVSLEIYLISAIFDIIIFDYAKQKFFDMKDFIWLFFIITPINFIGSVVCSLIYKKMYDTVSGLLAKKNREPEAPC
ncbi:MAG: acyltransferase family protein [Lachnospiraceae bacterium]|nr:acyltransferase family protein [Lachnospiraceae bacterium]